MIAALGPPHRAEWIEALHSGPDERPIRLQLVEHARVIALFFRDLHRGLGLLQAAGIDPARACEREHSTPEQAFRAFVSWLQRAQEQRRLAACDIEVVASTILGSLHGHAFTAQIHGQKNAPASEEYVERFVNVLWSGIGV
ncbi:MAG: TetR/AcrR family transcriptional regulator C-terminal domain-containing protein [Myxococcota bacterium]